MSDPAPPPRPDPWAVVEHHAARAAAAAGRDGLTDTQRLALYAAAAPGVIGARRVDSATLGHTIRRAAGADAEWWAAAIPPAGQELAWTDAGLLALRRPSRSRGVALGVAVLGCLLAFGAFGRLAGPRAIIPAAVVGVALFAVVRRAASDWSLLDGEGDAPVKGAIRGFVEAYEREVKGKG